MQEDKGRLVALDALRGFAALSVLAVHLWWAGQFDVFAMSSSTVQKIKFGETGVLLFFVISGFSLDLTMPRHLRHPRPFTSYTISRVFRIAPLFYLLIPVTIARDLVIGAHAAHGPLAIFLNVSFLFNLRPGYELGIVWASWTIGVEVIFYCLFPLIYDLPIWITLTGTLSIYAGTLAIWHHVVFGDFGYHIFSGFLPIFALGMATHRAYSSLCHRPRSWAKPMLIGSVGLLVVLADFYNDANSIWLRLPIALVYAGLILSALLLRPRILANKFTSLYGALSYAIYLVQFPVLLLIKPFLNTLFHGLSPINAFLIAYPIVTSFMTAICYIIYAYFEKPCDNLGRRIAENLRHERVAETAS